MEENENPVPQQPEQPGKADILDVCKALLGEMDADEALAKVEAMAADGEIAEADFQRAREYLSKAADGERAEAEQLFGLKFAD